MPTPALRLQVTGDAAAAAAAELAARVRALDPQAEVATAPAAGADDAVRRGLDPLTLAGVVLAIPCTVLAVLDLADRIAKRRRAKALLDGAKVIEIERHVRIRVVTADGTKAIEGLTVDELLDLAGKDGG